MWTKLREGQTRFALYMLRGQESKHGLFVPDCLWHVLTLYDEQVSKLEVNGITFNEALGQWLDGQVTLVIEDDCGERIACNPKCPVHRSESENRII